MPVRRTARRGAPRRRALQPRHAALALPACGHPITALENIPIISWLILRGKCSACSDADFDPLPDRRSRHRTAHRLCRLAFRLWLGCGWSHPVHLGLIALTVIDFDTQLLPDSDHPAAALAGPAVQPLRHLYTILPSAVIGAMAGYLSLWSVYWGFKLATGKEGMGFGDFKLLAALGAWLGWQMLPLTILLSSLCRGGCRHCADRAGQAWAQRTDSLRPLPGGRRTACPVLGQGTHPDLSGALLVFRP